MSNPSNRLNRPSKKTTTKHQRPGWSAFKWIFGGLASIAILGGLLLTLGLVLIYPKLPDVSVLQDYQPKLPLRVYAKGGELIGEFGAEKRRLVRVQNIPEVLKKAVLATEDTRFYEHSGVDSVGLARAFVANLSDFKSQGASTITMQVARNVYLNAEKTLTRKLYELMLTYKLESALSKDQIFEIYLNQIYMGNRAYGFGAASEAYFGKPLAQITLPEAALLAGLPKAPNTYNPLRNYERSKSRQEHVLSRMQALELITPEQAQAAKDTKLKLAEGDISDTVLVAQYPAETIRQMVYSQYGEEAYTRGLNVYTSIDYAKQKAAYHSVRSALLAYESNLPYRGPEQYIDLPKNPEQLNDVLATVFSEVNDTNDIRAAVVIKANPKKIELELSSGERVEITSNGLEQIKDALTRKAPTGKRIVPGALIRVYKQGQEWRVVQLPEAQAALVALSPQNGAIETMIGGFDFELHQFNRVTQAWRQPGSSLKPFIYSGALEWGMGPATIVNDAPVNFTDSRTKSGGVWKPKNFSNTFHGPMKLREGLARSKNMVAIRVLEKLGPKQAQTWLGNFGFEAKRHPPYLTMALGTGSVTPLQMATAYAIFANGGLRVQPWLIGKIVNSNGIVLQATNHPRVGEAQRVIPKRNAFIMSTMLQRVTSTGGTAARAQKRLRRDDVYGKTGTTNDTLDAWFVGFQPSIVAAVWVGYDKPRSLGKNATGGGIALPIWLDFMQVALKEVPRQIITPPRGVTLGIDGEWYYKEYADGSGVRSIGLDTIVGPVLTDDFLAPFALQPNTPSTKTPPKVTQEEKAQLLDLFKLN